MPDRPLPRLELGRIVHSQLAEHQRERLASQRVVVHLKVAEISHRACASVAAERAEAREASSDLARFARLARPVARQQLVPRRLQLRGAVGAAQLLRRCGGGPR